jgi:uroporphyrinogen-III synthase
VRLLVTRPEPDGARTGSALRARGHAVLLAPLLRVEAVDAAIADVPYGGVVMTSANAARAIASHSRHAALAALPVFAVGRRSAEAARAAGFRDVRCADGDRDDLVALIREEYRAPSGQLLYLAGEDRAGELELAGSGVEVVTAVVYRAVTAEKFPDAVTAALAPGALDGVLHFSRRSAEAYLACARRASLLAPALAPVQYCLSAAVAAPLAAAGAAAVRIAPRPDEAALLELVGSG